VAVEHVVEGDDEGLVEKPAKARMKRQAAKA